MSEQTKNPAATPESNPADDVATLYSWANLHGAKYRDFTASRQEMRAQARYRAAEAAAENPVSNLQAMPAPIVDENIHVGGRQKSTAPVTAAALEATASQRAPEVLVPVEEPRRAGFEETAIDAAQHDHAPIMPAWLKPVPVSQSVPVRSEAPSRPEPMAPVSVPPIQALLDSQMATPAGGEPRGVGERYEYRPSMEESARYSPQQAPPAPQYPPPYSQQPASTPGRAAMRWSALQNLFEPVRRNEPVVSSVPDLRVPVVAIFSVAGGVGKTSLAASVGRALAAYGERVLLTETSAHGVLPFYFGARNSRPGMVRTFASNSPQEVPIQVLSLDGDCQCEQEAQSHWLVNELYRASHEAGRIVVDVTGGLLGTMRQVAQLNPVVVVPVLPDISSMVALQSIDNFFDSQRDGHGRPVKPWFLLNQFDPSVPLHRDVRDMLHQKYGDRLLPFVIHRSSAVSEALAEGLTVMDYAPAAEVANDVLHFAGWIRSLANAGASAYRGVRWSER